MITGMERDRERSMRYEQKPYPAQPSYSYATKYQPGRPTDELLDVARKVDCEAILAEVGELGVVVVRYLRTPDDHPAEIDYVVVEEGAYLVYSARLDVLYAQDAYSFEHEHEMESGS